MERDLRVGDKTGIHRLLTSLVAPRPIGWISTRSEDGTLNLAPFSYFNLVHTDPPVVLFAAEDNDGRMKDTPTNAVDTGEFVVNVVTESLAEPMDGTAVGIDAAASEFDYAGLDAAQATTVDVPYVADAAARLECTLYDTRRVYSSTLVFGEVQYVHASGDLLTDGRVDARKINLVGRLGGPYFTRIDHLPLTRTTEY